MFFAALDIVQFGHAGLISMVERPSFVSVAPRYWLLTSIPYACALFDSLSVNSCCSSLLPPIRSMSSTNLRLLIFCPSMETKGSYVMSLS